MVPGTRSTPGTVTPAQIQPTQIQFTTVQLLDMTPEARIAWVEATRNQYAIPAQEQTKQAQERTLQVCEETKQQRAPLWVIGLIAIGVLVLLGINAWNGKDVDGTILLFLLALALAAVGGPPVAKFAKDWLGKKFPGLT